MTPPHRSRSRPECRDSSPGPPAARAEALEPTTCWCVCDNLHHHGVFALQAAGVDVEPLLQTAIVEVAVRRTPGLGGRQEDAGVQKPAHETDADVIQLS